jgi:hypothetical protein
MQRLLPAAVTGRTHAAWRKAVIAPGDKLWLKWWLY